MAWYKAKFQEKNGPFLTSFDAIVTKQSDGTWKMIELPDRRMGRMGGEVRIFTTEEAKEKLRTYRVNGAPIKARSSEVADAKRAVSCYYGG